MAEIITIPTVQASANSNILELLQNAVTQLQQMLDQFREGGQVIVDLRILHLSGIWNQVHAETLDAKPLPIVPSGIPFSTSFFKKAAY